MKISLICVYNNEKQLNEQLAASLKKQKCEVETIFLNSEEHNFTSAAQALNYGARVASGDILIFSHQDIYIKESDGLKKFADAIENTDVGDIVGVVGVREKSKVYYSNLTDGDIYDSKILADFEEKLISVSTIDEAMFGMKKETWECHSFDEKLCDNWHLYAVELSLYARKNGHNVFVYPIQVHHFSRGIITLSYMNGLKNLCSVYGKDFKYIWTTCYKVRTNKFYINTLVLIWILNRKLHGRKYR